MWGRNELCSVTGTDHPVATVIWLTLLIMQDYNYFTQANEFVMAKVAASRKRPLPDMSDADLPRSAPAYLMQNFKYTDASKYMDVSV